jgi:hypothetical protein
MINIDINKEERERVSSDVKEFLKNGGKIKKLKGYKDKPLNIAGHGRGLGSE